MSRPTRADQIAAEADERVAGWPSLSPAERASLTASGAVSKLQSGGFLVELGGDFPAWCPDMGAVRRLLLERDLVSAEGVAKSS
jgi:hypothetical protein